MKINIGLLGLVAVISACAPQSNPSAGLDSGAQALVSDSLPGGSAMFNSPWQNSETTIVIDAYQNNSIDWDEMASDPRVAGIIHRSSIGLQIDGQYLARQTIARDRGYLWGAYHIGTSEDPVQQAKFFLQTVGGDPSTLWALDLENTSSPSMMGTAGAVSYLRTIYQQTGRIPVVYANNSVTIALNQALSKNALVMESRLWYARFISDISSFPTGIWSTYFLWQFSSEINCSKTGSCLYNVPGTEYDMDIDVFYGSKADLTLQWK